MASRFSRARLPENLVAAMLAALATAVGFATALVLADVAGA